MSDTEANVEQTKPTVPTDAVAVNKINVYLNKNNKWEADIEYLDADGKTISGESRTFDEFSQATAWVAGSEVDAQGNEHNATSQEPSTA